MEGSVGCSDCVLECPVVEDRGGELREDGMHAVLNHETDGTNPEQNQSLKERLRQASSEERRRG